MAKEEQVFSDGDDVPEEDYDAYRVIELEEALRKIIGMAAVIPGTDSNDIICLVKKTLIGKLKHER